MVMSFSLLDVELDLDLWPEALNALSIIPLSDFKLDTPRNALAGRELFQRVEQAFVRSRGPILDPSVLIC